MFRVDVGAWGGMSLAKGESPTEVPPMNISHALAVVLGACVLSTIACGSSSSDSSAAPAAGSQDVQTSRLSANEKKSTALDSDGVCRTTCQDENGDTVDSCRAGL